MYLCVFAHVLRMKLTYASGACSTHLPTDFDSHRVFIGTFPIGCEPSEFHNWLRTDHVQDYIQSMRAKFRGTKVIVGVDRLDYIKGMPQKLRAFDKFLESSPEWIGRAVLLQVTIPSRANLELHQNLLESVQTLVGKINGKYGKPTAFFSTFSAVTTFASLAYTVRTFTDV
jgi:trehalose 6-phosphate synthase